MKWIAFCLGAIAIVVASVVWYGQPAASLKYGVGSYGTCQFSTCSITLSADTTVSVNVTPVGSTTTCTVSNANVSVSTGSSTGYTLYLSDDSSSSTLTGSNGGLVAPTSGTSSSPGTLAANTWGYRVDAFGNFGNGPTSSVANAAVPSVTFAAVPLLASPNIVASQAIAASTPVITAVKYGVCINTTIPNGVYTNSVVYTAITN